MSKKLLFFSYDFPPLEGGISRLCDEIVKQFIKNKWNVQALSVKRTVQDGFSNTEYPIETVENKRGLRELHSLWKLMTFSKDTLVLTGVWYPEALLVTLTGYKNLVILAHGNDVMKGKKTRKNRVLFLLRKWVMNRAKLVICNSHYTQEVVKNQFPNVRTSVCLLGVDEQRFTPIGDNKEIRKKLGLPENKKIILTVSRINKYKAHDIALKALALLPVEQRSKMCYCIAGKGDYLDTLKALALKLNVYDCIHWFGYIDEKQLPDLYRASDLFVLCTREEKDQKVVEGFGLVFLEAQACGVPVIGSKQGGIPDAIKEGDGGWLIKRDDADTLAMYFTKLLLNDKLFKKEGYKARIRILSEATWDHFAHKVFTEINKIEDTK